MPLYHRDILWRVFANVNNYFGLFATHFFTNSTTGTTDTHRVPAIYKILRDRKDRKVFEIKAHPMVSKLFEMKLYNSIKFSVTDVPMLVPPLPWNSTKVYLSFLFIFFNCRNYSCYSVFSRVFCKLVICLLNRNANSTRQIGPDWARLAVLFNRKIFKGFHIFNKK